MLTCLFEGQTVQMLYRCCTNDNKCFEMSKCESFQPIPYFEPKTIPSLIPFQMLVYAVYVQIHTFCATPLLTGGELIDMVGESTDGG